MSIVNLLSITVGWKRWTKVPFKKPAENLKPKFIYKNMSLGFRELLKVVLQVLSSYNNLYIR